jgi:hypothetical protein
VDKFSYKRKNFIDKALLSYKSTKVISFSFFLVAILFSMQRKVEEHYIKINHKNEFINELSSFFDLLAKFDYEDKQREKLENKSNSP